jgi:hypothetical protein
MTFTLFFLVVPFLSGAHFSLMSMAGITLWCAVIAWLSCMVACWPGMHKPQHTDASTSSVMSHTVSLGRIGPDCTVGAHNTPIGPCPDMKQPLPPPNSTAASLHVWPSSYVVDWTMAFIPDMSFTPPFPYGLPNTPMNITFGTTYYEVHTPTMRSMRETYEDFCIPVFSSLSTNRGGCSFINYMADETAKNGTSYVVFEDPSLPRCCIIGTQFHPPPPTFAQGMPLHYRDTAAGTLIDWNVVWSRDAGPFAYGFDALSGVPSTFYMTGLLGGAPLWAYQQFVAFRPNVTPPPDVWELPSECATAVACPGWEPIFPS